MKKIDLVKTTAKLFGTAALSTFLLAQSVDARPRKEFGSSYIYGNSGRYSIINFPPYPYADYYVSRTLSSTPRGGFIDYSNSNLMSLIDENGDKKFNEKDPLHKKHVLPALEELYSNEKKRYRAEIANPFIATNIVRHLREKNVDRNSPDFEEVYANAVNEAKLALFDTYHFNESGVGCSWIGDAMDHLALGKDLYLKMYEEIKRGTIKGGIIVEKLREIHKKFKTKEQRKEFRRILSIYNQVTLDLDEFGVLDERLNGEYLPECIEFEKRFGTPKKSKVSPLVLINYIPPGLEGVIENEPQIKAELEKRVEKLNGDGLPKEEYRKTVQEIKEIQDSLILRASNYK